MTGTLDDIKAAFRRTWDADLDVIDPTILKIADMAVQTTVFESRRRSYEALAAMLVGASNPPH